MASYSALAAAGLSLEGLLNRCIEAEVDRDEDAFQNRPTARLVRSDDFNRDSDTVSSVIQGATLSIFCYRVDLNPTMRAAWSAVAAHDGQIHLPIDQYFLLTAWDSDAEAELRMLGFAMQCLEQHPILAGPRLHPDGRWAPGEAVQVVCADQRGEDVIHTFETLTSDFRLSVSYLARIVRIDAHDEPDHPDVVTAVRGITPSPVPVP
jgi:hypothetical protein